MQNKNLEAKVKALTDGDAPDGAFRAVVAAYNVDSYGDKIVPGAFQKSLAKWQESGNTMPVIWAHQHQDPDSYIGSVTKAEENENGLVIEGQLDIADNPKAARVYKLLKGGRVNNYSFAYRVNDYEYLDEKSDDGAQVLLKELDIYEAGPCLVGVNTETRTEAIKSDLISEDELPAKTDESGEDLSTEEAGAVVAETLKWMKETLTELVAWKASFAGEEKNAQPTEPQVDDEEPSEAKSRDEEPSEAKSTNATQDGPVDNSEAEFAAVEEKENSRDLDTIIQRNGF